MTALLIWFVAYVLPFAGGYVVAVLLPHPFGKLFPYQLAVAHVALVVSILLSLYNTHAFPWHAHIVSLAVYAASVGIALLLLGWLGFWYGMSAFIQQATMLLISFILLPAFPLYAVILLVVPFYAIAHFLRLTLTLARFLFFFAWGALAITIFALTHNIWLTASLHTLGGAFLIKRGFLYMPEFKNGRSF